MSQTRTQAPGMNSIYSRPAAPSAKGGTVVPGMHKTATDAPGAPVTDASAPVVGFLYSLSRKGIGEYWPVHIGRNTIGRNEECDVRLAEGTVSGVHALLNVKQLKTGDRRLVAQIRDEGSKNGITVNDEELDFDNHEVKTNDIIRIGDNYQLLLLLINGADYGLSVAENFVDLGDTEEFPPVFGGQSTGDDTFSPYNSEHRASNGTQAIDGIDNFANGGTKFL
ncbi:MAG: FHA domain-containing protein [Pseudoflavonifractor sp.]|nr:FHA domain-containing protein [Alloprevotella sp.]MCM1116866.1 FHA domain-containing protein [Pseudoflavonifractor sp.]